MKVRDAQKLRDFLLIIGFVIMLSGCIWGETLFKIGAVVSLSCFIPHFLYNKCPHCKKQLGRNEGEFCQHCGGRISDSH